MASDPFPWLNRQEYPFSTSYFTFGGVRQHFVDTGRGPTLLFVHGTPSWSFDFRNVIKSLSTRFRCVAVDHVGFGLSDKPENYDYSFPNHSRTLERFIEHTGLEDITLVVHDFGGPIGFDYALRHPDNIKNIIVLNSWLWSSEHEPDFQRFKRLMNNPLVPFLYRRLNLSPKYLLPSSFGDRKLPKNVHRQYTKPFADHSQRNGTVAFLQSLLNDQPLFEALWQQRHRLHTKPILLIWGMKDKFVTPKYLNRFHEGFPYATVRQLPQCGHFPQEEQPEDVARFIMEFMNRNPEPVV